MDVIDIVVGNYQAERVLGQGGFATVYLGEHKRLHTNVAIKILKSHLSQREQQQFLTEARVLAQLRHPNIVEVLDFGIAEGSPYLVMPYLEHGSLRQYYKKGHIYSFENILLHVKQISLALQYAHEKKIIHRDVKPENVLLGNNEDAILSDFGIAVLNVESHRQSRQDIVGTLPYMAPEQIQGFPRRSSDQYALAIMVYEWLCGSRPFTGKGFEQIALQHVGQLPPSLREKVPTISPAVEAVVLKALSKAPEERYATVKQFAEALEQIHTSPDRQTIVHDEAKKPEVVQEKTHLMPTRTASTFAISQMEAELPPSTSVSPELSSPFTMRRKLLIGGSVAIGVALLGGGIWWSQPFSQRTTDRGSSAAQMLTPVSSHTLETNIVESIAWSSDNNQIVYGSTDKEASVHIVQWVRSNTIGLPYSGPVAWTPDGHYLAASSRNQVHLWNAQTRQEERVINLRDFSSHNLLPGQPALLPYDLIPRTLAWSSDSSRIAVGGDQIGIVQVSTHVPFGYLYLWPAKDMLVNPYAATYSISVVTWSPDSAQIAWGGDSGGLSIAKLPSRSTRDYTTNYSQVVALTWSSNSTLLMAGANWQTQLVDTTKLQIRKSFPKYAAPLSQTLRGDLVASASAQGNNYDIWIWNSATGTPIFTCHGHTDAIQALAWSHDGNFLASTSKDGTMYIWSIPQ